METGDYPASYGASDRRAVRLEALYFRLLRAELVLFLGASLVSVLISVPGMGYGRVLAAAAAILVSTAFVLLWWMRRTGLERKWFNHLRPNWLLLLVLAAILLVNLANSLRLLRS